MWRKHYFPLYLFAYVYKLHSIYKEDSLGKTFLMKISLYYQCNLWVTMCRYYYIVLRQMNQISLNIFPISIRLKSVRSVQYSLTHSSNISWFFTHVISLCSLLQSSSWISHALEATCYSTLP